MAIRVCVAGVSGWTGSAVTRAILSADEFELTGAIARRQAGRDTGELLGLPAKGVVVAASLGEALLQAGARHANRSPPDGPDDPRQNPFDSEKVGAIALNEGQRSWPSALQRALVGGGERGPPLLVVAESLCASGPHRRCGDGG
jgi:hypothetical protein